MSVVNDTFVRDTLRDLRNGSEDLALTRLRVALLGVFADTCDALKDVVAGRVVNAGGELEVAKAAADAVEEYKVRMEK